MLNRYVQSLARFLAVQSLAMAIARCEPADIMVVPADATEAGGGRPSAGAGGPGAGGSNGTGGSQGDASAVSKQRAGSSGDGGIAAAGGGSADRADAAAHEAPTDGANPRDAIADRAGEGGAMIAATPPMGWNTWNTFSCDINENLVRGAADAMVSSGMKAAGYEYVNIDDCWMNGRDAQGNLRWNADKFPSGIPALAEYIHKKGLKIGIYETPNTTTCGGIYQGLPRSVAVGSLGHEEQDARAFASWGIDYLKYDLCQGKRSSFAVMRDALRATARSIVYSINPGNGPSDLCPPNATGSPGSKCSLDLPQIANLWRIGFDINASWGSVTSLIDQDAPLARYAGPGHWNDPDMLEVGRGMTAVEDRAHFSMWAILAAPLLAGNDIRTMSAATQAILTNPEVIAVDQDALGVQGSVVATPERGLQIWSKELSESNTRAVALLNRSASAATMTVTFAQLGLPVSNVLVRDLWEHKDLGTFTERYTASDVPSNGVVMLRIASAL